LFLCPLHPSSYCSEILLSIHHKIHAISFPDWGKATEAIFGLDGSFTLSSAYEVQELKEIMCVLSIEKEFSMIGLQPDA
jgi:hypothetical protein